MKRIIILSISILVTLVGTFLLGLYDFKVWLNPSGKNATTITTEYRAYLVQEMVDFKNNETPIQNTESKIDLYRVLSNYKYTDEPIYHNENEYFTIDIYQNQFWYVNSDLERELEHFRYEIFVYNVNYDLLKTKFKGQTVPGKATVDNAEYPYLVINFYPNDSYNVDEALSSPKVDSNGDEIDTTAPIHLYDGTKMTARKFGAANEISLFDYSSTPSKDKSGDVFNVNFLAVYDYSNFIGNDNRLYNDNRDLFNNGCYLKVDAVLSINDNGTELNYTLSDSLLKDKVDKFTLDTKEITNIKMKEGFTTSSNSGETITNVKIEGVKTYNAWVIGKYLWWHCLIAFLIISLVMTGFYFIFTYEEKGKINKKKHKRPIKK